MNKRMLKTLIANELIEFRIKGAITPQGEEKLASSLDAWIDQLDEPQKVTVPKVAIDYYEEYKNRLSGFDEWFGDFFDSGFLEEFPDGEKLAEWLYDNPNEVNSQRELALATLIVNGPSAVEVEKETLYIVEIPNPNRKGNNRFFLHKDPNTGKILLCKGNFNPEKNKNLWLTESEIRKDFEWAWQWAEEVKG